MQWICPKPNAFPYGTYPITLTAQFPTGFTETRTWNIALVNGPPSTAWYINASNNGNCFYTLTTPTVDFALKYYWSIDDGNSWITTTSPSCSGISVGASGLLNVMLKTENICGFSNVSQQILSLGTCYPLLSPNESSEEEITDVSQNRKSEVEVVNTMEEYKSSKETSPFAAESTVVVDENTAYKVYDISGRLLLASFADVSSQSHPNLLVPQNMPNGIYIVRILGDMPSIHKVFVGN